MLTTVKKPTNTILCRRESRACVNFCDIAKLLLVTILDHSIA